MVSRLELSRVEILALKRFRSDNDGRLIKQVLERTLGLARQDNESEHASEENRLRVKATKDILDILFNAEVVSGE